MPIFTPNVHVTHAGLARYPPASTFGPRRTRDFEFVWLIEGDAVYDVDDVRHHTPEGSVVLCRPGTVDGFTWDRHRRTVHGYFHFTVQKPESAWGEVGQWPWVRQPGEVNVLQPALEHVAAWAPHGDPIAISLAATLSLRVFITGDWQTQAATVELYPEPIERALAYIAAELDARPDQPLRFDAVAKAAGVTGPHLCRLFRRHLNLSPMQVGQAARLNRALTLVARTNYSVKQIAAMLGYANAFHFSRLFSAGFGQSPMQLRQLVRQGGSPPLPLLLTTGKRRTAPA